jgi:hypothetical protein
LVSDDIRNGGLALGLSLGSAEVPAKWPRIVLWTHLILNEELDTLNGCGGGLGDGGGDTTHYYGVSIDGIRAAFQLLSARIGELQIVCIEPCGPTMAG